MKKAMVIGAAGWLGQTLVERLLKDGRDVIAVDVRIPETWEARSHLETRKADIRDIAGYAGLLATCDVVFNCCGLQHPASTKELYAVNAEAPEAVYRACEEQGVKTFVQVSSIAAHGANKDGVTFITEESPLAGITHYGRSKAEGDRRLVARAREGATRLIILRPGVFYGIRPSKNLLEFMQKIQTSVLPLFSKDGYLRSYLDIEKMVDALLLSETRGKSGAAYLISDREPLGMRRFYELLADELGAKPRIVAVPALVAHAAERAARIAGSRGVHLRLPTILGEFGRHTFCWPGKAENELGFVPHQSPEEGLRAMARMAR